MSQPAVIATSSGEMRPPGSIPANSSTWEETLGSSWRVDLGLFVGVLFFIGLLTPLFDPDLPMHLVIGQWVVEHGQVPYVEPFAWTRAGEPYYAYSWLPQTAFYLSYSALGPAGLRLMQGLLLALMAVAALLAARWLHFRPVTALMLAGLNAFMGLLVTRALRPQMILLITIPLLWGLVALLIRRQSLAAPALGIVLCSAVTANSHLFFPITLAPLALGLMASPIQWRRLGLGGLCVVLGWLAGPYGLLWPDVYRLYFAPNALMSWPPVIVELIPGFVGMTDDFGQMAFPAIVLSLLPWMLANARISVRERWLAALLWLPGILAFGLAQRLLLAWWLLMIVPVGWALRSLSDEERKDRPPRLRAKLPMYALAVVVIVAVAMREASTWKLDGGDGTRRLATANSFAAGHLAEWLVSETRDGASGRLLTNFNLGSYLTWRLPAYSASVDSRGIFPDSVVAADAFMLASQRETPLGPWRSSELAILPLNVRLASVLDTATSWRRMATFRSDSVVGDSAALWVRSEWWANNGRNPLRHSPVDLTY